MRYVRWSAVVLVILAGAEAVLTLSARAQDDDRREGERRVRRLEVLSGRGSGIGVSLRDVDRSDVAREKLASEAGAVIEEVQGDGAAAKAGFKAGDVVVEFDGERVRSAGQLARLVRETPQGRTVSATVSRAGQRVDLEVTTQRAAGMAFLPEGLPDRLNELGRNFRFDVPDLRDHPSSTGSPGCDAAALVSRSRS